MNDIVVVSVLPRLCLLLLWFVYLFVLCVFGAPLLGTEEALCASHIPIFPKLIQNHHSIKRQIRRNPSISKKNTPRAPQRQEGVVRRSSSR